MLTVDQLRDHVHTGDIDTVLVVFPDMQGRFMGKRMLASFFLSELHRNGGAIEACDYLLAVDVDMKVLDGFRFRLGDAAIDRTDAEVVAAGLIGKMAAARVGRRCRSAIWPKRFVCRCLMTSTTNT